MGTTAPQYQSADTYGWGIAGTADTGPVALAFVGRTSTSTVQNPVESLARQVRRARERLPEGFYITRYYWDVESGGTDLDARSRTDVWQKFADAGIPRDGGMADLRAAAASEQPPFSAVICENIERSGRDTFDALKLEKELRARGMVLFATDEPIDVQAAEGSTILVRRMKQGVAEYFRYQLKAQMWEGLRQYVIGGWNTGKIPYGYQADRSVHPNPLKASMGATRARLVPDPERGPWVTRIFEWRVYEKVSRLTIARRLTRAGAPSPDGKGWSPGTVASILRNPKYTGRVVLGRTRNTGPSTRPGERKIRPVPRAYWTWAADENRHPALVDMDLWEQAQTVGTERGNVRDTETQTQASKSRTVYPLRARVHCNQCQRRMHGITRPGRTPTSRKNVYYLCPHDPGNPRHAQAHPEHGRVSVKDEIIAAALARFADQYLLGYDRAAMLDIALPAGQAEEAERRERKADQLRARLDRIKTAQKGLMLQSEQLGDDTSPAANAYRDRIREQFTERYNEHAAVEAELDALTAGPAPVINDPTLLDELPYAPGLLAEAPTALRETLYAAFDIHCLYRHNAEQITIWATLTDTTPHIINAIATDPRTDNITPATSYADLQDAAIAAVSAHKSVRPW
jgi:site-specific DNA recombinase